MSQRIILVGHCGVDAPRLEKAVSKCLPRADVISVNCEEQLQEICDEGADLLLINRQLPFGFESEEGIELIEEMQQMHPDVKMILVSDRPDAQEQAKRAGAVDGFGKADLGSSRIAEVLKDALKGQPKPN
jgi:DNA-binding NtrC family response regulator